MNLSSTRYPNWQSIILTLFALSMLGVACSQTETTAGQVLNTDTPTPYPMDYPPEKQTAEVGVIQTEEAAWLTPEPTDYVTFPDITTTPFLLPTPVGTLAGAGLITTELGSPTSRGAFSISNAWLERTASGDIIVSAGARGTDPSQGVVIVNTRNGVFKDWYDGMCQPFETTWLRI